MLVRPSPNSTATNGREGISRFVKTDLPIPDPALEAAEALAVDSAVAVALVDVVVSAVVVDLAAALEVVEVVSVVLLVASVMAALDTLNSSLPLLPIRSPISPLVEARKVLSSMFAT